MYSQGLSFKDAQKLKGSNNELRLAAKNAQNDLVQVSREAGMSFLFYLYRAIGKQPSGDS